MTAMGGGDVDDGTSTGEIPPTAAVAIELFSCGGCGYDDAGKLETTSPGVDGRAGSAKGEWVAVQMDSEVGNICRICHLTSKLAGSTAEGWELIQIGCDCKGELGVAHRHCAEAWFRVKRNRLCEICGANAKNIVGEEDSSFMEQWYEDGWLGAGNNRNLYRQFRCWNSKSCCNFLLFFLVVVFILAWFFRANFF